MAIDLEKGQSFNLEKEAPNVTEFTIGLGWTVNKAGKDYDLDASILMLDDSDKLVETIYFGKLNSNCGSVKHSGDNLVGGTGNKDDEQIKIDLNKVPSTTKKLQIVVNIYMAKNRNQCFGDIKNAFCRVFETKSKKEVCKYQLNEDYKSATFIHTADLYRHENSWKFKAIGKGFNESLSGYCNKFNKSEAQNQQSIGNRIMNFFRR